jgi:hypothetical protein
MARRASSRAIAAVALAGSAVIGTLLVATVATGSVLGDRAPQHAATAPGRGGHPIRRRPFEVPGLPGWLIDLLLVLAILGVIAVVVFTTRRSRQTRERLQYEEEDPGDTDWDALILVELSEAAEEQLRHIEEGRPRNAIVACWLRFQQAAARAGLPPHSSETSTEFTVRALRRLAIDDAAITTLSELYREARFSRHPMGEAERRRAAAAVRLLADQASAAAPFRGSCSVPRSSLDIVTP